MEVALPLSLFPNHGPVLGLDLSVTNTADPTHPLVLFWQGDVDNWKDASRFGRVRVEGGAGPTPD